MIQKLLLPALLTTGVLAVANASDVSIPRCVRWVSVQLTENPSDDLLVELPHDAASIQFAEWLYGTSESPRIAVAVVMNDDGEYQLYVDDDRDGAISADDLVAGSGDLRKLSVAAWQVMNNVVTQYPRDVLFRRRGSRLQVATVTIPRHQMEEQNKWTARQIDGNANGLFSDSKDLIQLDLNHDDRFDPFLETFPFRPVAKVQGQRFFIKADCFGTRLELSSATATGQLRVQVKPLPDQNRITSLIVTLAGEDGSVYSLSGVIAESDLPVGRYAVSDLYMEIAPGGRGPGWQFTFSHFHGMTASAIGTGSKSRKALPQLLIRWGRLCWQLRWRNAAGTMQRSAFSRSCSRKQGY